MFPRDIPCIKEMMMMMMIIIIIIINLHLLFVRSVLSLCTRFVN